jgi:acyl transferase domain-containing protein
VRPAPILLEVGPGRTLGTLARQHPGRRAEGPVLGTLPTGMAAGAVDAETTAAVLAAVGRLWVEGVPVDWQALLPGDLPAGLPADWDIATVS